MDPTAQQQSSPQPSIQTQPPAGAGPVATAQPVIPSPTQPVAQPVSQPPPQSPNQQVYSQSGGQRKMGKGLMLGFVLIFVIALAGAIFFYLNKQNIYSIPDQNTTLNQPTVQPTDQLDTRMDEFDGAVRTSETDINNATGGLNDQPDNL